MCATDTRLFAVLAVLASGACSAGTTAPRRFLPSPQEAQTEAYGAWVDFTYAVGDSVGRFQGEFIAVSADSLWAVSGTRGLVVPHAALRSGRLAYFNSSPGSVGGLAFLGTLSTISNGAYLIFTAPMWMIGGAAAAGSQARLARRDMTPLSGPQLSTYARFPQGLPEGVELADLRIKAISQAGR
ncbi:MAG: hypothetical protein FJ207_09400 [Gemmatimonadetes bacterium]|nr:hypothetical protein [Gemmatimonadota bacterium]